MKIAVLGANGRSGQIFVGKALEAGYQINAGVRGLHHLPTNDNLKIIKGDVTNPQDITRLITGCNAVVSLIGHTKNSSKDVQTAATRNLIAAMDHQGIKRLISLTGTGVRFESDKITIIDRLLNLSVKIVDKSRVQDGADHVALLKSSDLDWTVIRVLKLTNGKAKPFSLSPNGPAKFFVSRHEVAEAIVDVLNQNSFIKTAPIVSAQHN